MLSRSRALYNGLRQGIDEAMQRGSQQRAPLVQFSANKSTSQTISTGSVATVTGWNTVLDTAGEFNPVTGIYTIPVTGKYLVTSALLFNTNTITSNLAIFCIVASGATLLSSIFDGQFTAVFPPAPGAAPANTSANCANIISLNAGTQLRINALLAGGGVATVTLSAAFLSNTFALAQVG